MFMLLSFSFDNRTAPPTGLDYTNNYKNNKSPDTINYEFLAKLYGTVDGSAQASSAVEGGYGRRMNKRGERNLFENVKNEVRRAELVANWQKISSQIENGVIPSQHEGWRLLHRSSYGEAHEIDLGEDYSLQVHLLRP